MRRPDPRISLRLARGAQSIEIAGTTLPALGGSPGHGETGASKLENALMVLGHYERRSIPARDGKGASSRCREPRGEGKFGSPSRMLVRRASHYPAPCRGLFHRQQGGRGTV